MIRFDRVSKRYPPGLDALSDLSFEVAEREMVVVSGHSGAGKSTLLKLIAAVEKSTGGAVLVGGQNVSGLARSALPFLRRRIGMVFQDQKLLFDRSAFDKAIGVTGLVITKLDGTAKGGVLAAIARQCPKPVRFIGVGEGIDDLQAFRANEFVEALLGPAQGPSS